MRMQVVDQSGRSHDVEARPGASLMEAIRRAGLPIAAQCGGCCSCATCHVYVDEAFLSRLPAPAEDETELLELAIELRPGSRLSCQIEAAPGLDGIRLELAPGTEG